MRQELVAPCGMNCNICKAHLREKDKCPGCAETNIAYRRRCIIANCKIRKRFCGCEKPCRMLKNLDKRYRNKYNMSMLENLGFIKSNGVNKFLEKERKKWKCKKCGGVVSCHDGKCYG